MVARASIRWPRRVAPALYDEVREAYLDRLFETGQVRAAYQSALAYYDVRAYDSAFLWDWSAVPGGREELGQLISASDDRYRQATTALGLVIANHLISAADAYLSARGGRPSVRLGFEPRMTVGGPAWSAVAVVPIGP